jgi:hypothetical protein
MAAAHPSPAEFLKKVLLAGHARGIVFREVPMAIYKLAVNNTTAELNAKMAEAPAAKRKTFEYAISVKAMFEHIIDEGLCKRPVLPAFTKTAFREGGFRTDAMAVLAFGLTKNGQNYKVVGVAAWGAADFVGTNDEELEYTSYAGWNEAVQNNRIVEIDIVCSAPGKVGNRDAKGYGSLLLAYCMARAAGRKKAGGPKFVGAVMNLPYFGTVANKRPPFKNVATRYGFAHMNAVNEEAYVMGVKGAHWYTPAYNAVPGGDDDFKILCPLVPRSGKTYCA